ncbi:hypothetical protein NDN13_01395 [Acinetobacter sp. C32I]|uniref:hypothetical protein n=1 Tax=Acinetobacter sp. C32I TaxID=2950074 RepID=UPI002036A575|nr:hypothetical protein [Acinetobacter sp. C32I]USA53875.1 hypothetical protein NDN13_01395 [Acinetobacter sp. C32I]
MRKILLALLLGQCIYGHAENVDMDGCTKVESIDNLSFMRAVFQTCGFNNQPKQKLLLKTIEQMESERCNFSPNEIKPDQNLVQQKIKELEKENFTSAKKLEACKKTSNLLQSVVKEYEDSKKPNYKVGSFDDPNIPGGYKQRCGMIVGHLNRTISDYQDAFYGKMPLDLMDEDRTIMSSDDSIPYTPYQIYDLDKKIKKLIFSDKKYASKLNTFMNNFKKQCLVDIQKYDKERTKRNSLHDYSKD